MIFVPRSQKDIAGCAVSIVLRKRVNASMASGARENKKTRHLGDYRIRKSDIRK